ncbi:Imm5 family immunity protein [Pseudomonas abietaniphila]|uniref:Imm5 family immunity protein n=1 Tax=Pseudomonas abietaniphila TaxID=89065 RepID=UPI00078572C8|nr:Imm5 family immunity protein [Pseudomonas abietaniphila]
MSEKSETLVKKLLEEVKASSSGELRLPLRRLLWATITADKSDAEKKVMLTALDVICVGRAGTFWSKKFGSEDRLASILSVATGVAAKIIPQDQALSIRDEFYLFVVEDQEYDEDEYPAMFVGHAAANTIATAVNDFLFDPADLRNDRDLDPEAFEPSYLVASTFAGGLGADGDTERRRQFWDWYLNIAVPQVV